MGEKLIPTLQVRLTPAIKEILQSKEAKHYIDHIERAQRQLVNMIERECQGQAIKIAPDYADLAKTGYEVVLDFMPNVANCALQDYGRLNDFMIAAAKEFPDVDPKEDQNDLQTDDRSTGQQADENSEASG